MAILLPLIRRRPEGIGLLQRMAALYALAAAAALPDDQEDEPPLHDLAHHVGPKLLGHLCFGDVRRRAGRRNAWPPAATTPDSLATPYSLARYRTTGNLVC